MKKFKLIGKIFLILIVIGAIWYTLSTDVEGDSTDTKAFKEQVTHKSISLVKDAKFDDTNLTNSEAFNIFFGNGKWTSFISTKKTTIVEFNGKCNYRDKEVNCKIQYILTDDKKTYELQSMSFNNIEQPKIIYQALFATIKKTVAPESGDINPGEVKNTTNTEPQGDTIHNQKYPNGQQTDGIDNDKETESLSENAPENKNRIHDGKGNYSDKPYYGD